MYFLDYLKQLNLDNLSINFDTHFYLKRDKENEENYYKTLQIYNNIIAKLFNFVLSTYKWKIKSKGYENIPNEIIEKSFCFYGGISIFKNAVGDIDILPAVPSTKVNKYGKTDELIVHGLNGYTEKIQQIYKKDDFKKSTGIYIEDNITGYSSVENVVMYARLISDKMRALEIATQKLKKPFIFFADKTNKNNLNKFYENFKNNAPLIIQTNKLLEDNNAELANYEIDPDNIKAIKESILFDLSQFLEIYGINTDPNPDKMERKLVDEVNANNQFLNINRKVRKDKRDELKEKAKKICGIDLEYIENMKGEEEDDGQQIQRGNAGGFNPQTNPAGAIKKANKTTSRANVS